MSAGGVAASPGGDTGSGITRVNSAKQSWLALGLSPGKTSVGEVESDVLPLLGLSASRRTE